MWTGFVYRDTSDEVSREGWWEKWKRFDDYDWVFTESKPTGVCIILTTTPDGKDDPKTWRLKAADEDTACQTRQNSCTIS
jgi:hypothetical protein